MGRFGAALCIAVATLGCDEKPSPAASTTSSSASAAVSSVRSAPPASAVAEGGRSARQRYIEQLASDTWKDDTELGADSPELAELARKWDGLMWAFLRSERTTARELHHFASKYDWDKGVPAMQQLVRHPHCDAGTALMVYWRARPEYYRAYAAVDDVPEREREQDALIRDIEARFAAGSFETREMPYDPRAAGQLGLYDERPVKRKLPDVMYRAIE
ncbi:MAG: DUF4274 domain-containing protein [Deltaproteobacteria bacterium]|jgi:hypothetical protein|nr:DUF4274 domain-containing protein [Deltaproteobacteria bacterium]MBW2534625.1 DUF4274 domain-containing protein [Deltaproteobacteria bacterium]